jgi:hypothetical protein
VAGRIAFHRRVVLLAGVPGVWVAAVCLLTVAAVVPPAAGLLLAGVVLVPGLALGVVLGFPDQVFATVTQYASLAAAAGLTATLSAAVLQRHLL